MNNEIIYDANSRKVTVSDNLLEIIKFLTKSNPSNSNLEKEFTNEFSVSDFNITMDEIISKINIHINYLPDKDNEINYDVDLLNSLVKRYDELLPLENRESHDNFFIEGVKKDKIPELLDVIYKIVLERRKFYLTRGLINAKENCIENMKYFLDEEVISAWAHEYDEAIKDKDIQKMQSMYDELQQKILKEWEKYFSNQSDMNDDNFLFIGHSTNSTTFDGSFKSKYVSASLFNQNLTDTYRGGYGFILSPKVIVGASSKDMYVNNYVTDESDLLNSGLDKIIDHPKKLIEECEKRKAEKEDEAVYSEVVLKGFDPIGIFCFTDGSKGLNDNEKNARKLQESFPNLKVHCFDTMKQKKGAALNSDKVKLINNLMKKLNPAAREISENEINKFDYFFENFEKLKQIGEYDEKTLITIFKRNYEMLYSLDTDSSMLFNGNFNENEINYILRKNTNYNIDDIINGKATKYTLNKLKELYPYKDKLSGIDGLETLVELVTRINVTDKMMDEINNLPTRNLLSISKYLTTNLESKVNLQTEYNNLMQEYQERLKLEAQYNFYKKIQMNMWSLKMIKDDYSMVINDINDANKENEDLQAKMEELEEQIEKLRVDKDENSKKDYKTSNQCFKNEEKINAVKNEIEILSKHPIMNIRKIKELNKKIKELNEENEKQKNEFECTKNNANIDIDYKIIELELNKNYISSSIKFNENMIEISNKQLESIKKKMKEQFNYDNLEDIFAAIDNSKKFMKNYDSSNLTLLIELERKIEKLSDYINKEQNNSDSVQKDNDDISIKK